MRKYSSIKEECFEANLTLPRLGLVLFTFGNVSAADRKAGVFAIKPSGMPYDSMTPDDIVVLDFEGTVVEGRKKPSSDSKTHAVLYKNWESIAGICHTHSTYAVAWSQAGKDIPIYGTTHADHAQKSIPCTNVLSEEMIKGNYELETGNHILKHFAEKNISYKNMEMVLVQNHGPFTWGSDAAKSVYNAAVLEEIAHMAQLTLSINPETTAIKNSLIQKHYHRKHGKGAYYGQE